MRRGNDDLVRTGQGLNREGKWGRGRHNLTWEQVVRTDMAAYGIDGNLAGRVGDPTLPSG